jgi:Xaa-Pro aminopeptidase
VPPSTSTASSAEAERKRILALEAAREAGYEALAASAPENVRWLLCGRGRPVSASAAESPYTVVVGEGRSCVLVPDIERPRVAAEERFGELGLDVETFPWHEGNARVLARVLAGARAARDADVEHQVGPLRRELCESERARYGAAGADAGEAVVAVLGTLEPALSELEVAGRLASELAARGFSTPVVLVGGEDRMGVYRHPLPTTSPLGRRVLLAVTAERDGLHVSLTRIASFGPPDGELVRLVQASAQVDAVMLHASRPGATLGEVFAAAGDEYARLGFPDEWRLHHQGGLTGYRGREVFAVPGDETPLPSSCAVAWNPSIGGGGKSEDTALVSPDGVEIVSRTPGLPVDESDGIARPAIVEL